MEKEKKKEETASYEVTNTTHTHTHNKSNNMLEMALEEIISDGERTMIQERTGHDTLLGNFSASTKSSKNNIDRTGKKMSNRNKNTL